MGSRNAHGCAQNLEMALVLTFLEQHHKDSNEFFSYIVRVTGDET
jgi:hypothetical protein